MNPKLWRLRVAKYSIFYSFWEAYLCFLQHVFFWIICRQFDLVLVFRWNMRGKNVGKTFFGCIFWHPYLIKRYHTTDIPLMCWWVHMTVLNKLVGPFLLNNLSHVIDKSNVGLYRDDGLGVLRSHSGPETERKQKEIIKHINQ